MSGAPLRCIVAPYGGIEIDEHPSRVRYVERIRERPAVEHALRVERPRYAADTAGA